VRVIEREITSTIDINMKFMSFMFISVYLCSKVFEILFIVGIIWRAFKAAERTAANPVSWQCLEVGWCFCQQGLLDKYSDLCRSISPQATTVVPYFQQFF